MHDIVWINDFIYLNMSYNEKIVSNKAVDVQLENLSKETN